MNFKPDSPSKKDGAAQLEQESTVVNGQQPDGKLPTKSVLEEEQKVDPADIKIDLAPKEEDSAPEKAESEKEEDVIPDVYEKPMSWLQYYRNAFRYYNRIGSMIFSSNVNSKRPIKVLNTFTQISIAISIVVVVIHFDGHVGKDKQIAIWSTFLLMRFV